MRKELICLLAAGVVLWAGQSLYAQHVHTGSHCYTCHIPHNAGNLSVPLWNPTRGTTKTFTMYTSPTFANLNVNISAQPDGAAQLCLGCHDGTGVHLAARVFGPNLNNMHPISFVYDSTLSGNSNGLLNNPISSPSNLPGGGTIDTDLLDVNHEVQCTTCHDIHKAGVGNFNSGGFTSNGTNNFYLRYAWDPTVPNDNVMCRVCHNK